MPLSGTELMTRALDALSKADLDAFLELTDPEVEFNSLIAEADTRRTFHGHEGVREWWETVQQAFGGLTFTAEESRELTDPEDVVVAKLRVGGEIRGVRIEQVMWQAARRSGDKATWWWIGRSEEEVLAAAREAFGGG